MTAKKKKLIKGLVAVALIAIIGIGATLAYLTATTNKVENKFSSDNTNLKGKTVETQWETNHKGGWTDYKPGDSTVKDPKVELTGTESGWVAMKLSFRDASGSTVSYDTFKGSAYYSSTDNGDNKVNKGWTLIARNGQGEELYMYDTIQASPGSTATIFDKVTVNAGISTVNSSTTKTYYTKKDVYDAKGNLESTTTTKVDAPTDSSTTYYDEAGNAIGAGDKLPHFQIDAQSYAIQSSNVDKTLATSKLIDQANEGIDSTSSAYFNSIA